MKLWQGGGEHTRESLQLGLEGYFFARWGETKNVPIGGYSMAKSSGADLAQGL